MASASPRLVILDPSGRSASELCAVAARAGVQPVVAGEAAAIDPALAAAVLVPAASAGDVASLPASVPRWLYGDLESSARLAAAAVTCGASGVVLTPTRPEVIKLLVTPPAPGVAEVDLARARSLIAAAVLDGAGEPTKDGLAAIARAFAADDCVLWWREGDGMAPWGTRPVADSDQATLGAAARVAAATGLTVVAASARRPLAVAAAPLTTGPQEVGGLVAVVADRARRFLPAELADLRALSARLPRELTFRAGHRRLLVEHERLAAGAQQDPLTGAMSRSAFEQEVAGAIASASRQAEALALVLLDVVGLRRVNLERGHKAGDAVLAALAARVRAHVRGNDRVSRFGGDELAILFRGTDTGRAQQAARKLAAHIAATPIPTIEGEVSIQVRGAVTAVADGERSGEAAFARLRHAARSARPGAVVVAGNTRGLDTGEGALDDAAAGVTTGTTLGGTYRILHELSRGAMGVVYRGEDLGLARPVAIKVLRSDLASDAQLVAKFRAEAAMLASLHHTNLVQVYSLGEHQGDVYFVMELVEGQALAEVLDAQHAAGQWLPFEALAQITLEIGDALDAMHHIGLIHRDVKPANVLLDRERDRAVLVDVGVAKRRGDEVDGAGTPGYAAPESFLEGSTESPETDVYGLAATMFCALTGRPPFGSGQLMQVITRQLHDPLLRPSQLRPGLAGAVDEVMAKALDPDPRRRFASASAFAIALARALERAPRPAASDTAGPAPGQVPPAAVLKQTELLQGGVRPASASTEHPEMVRAAHFRVAARVIAHLAGDATVRALAEADPELAMALAADASPLGWLPLTLLCTLVERAAAHVPGGKGGRDEAAADQLMRAIGRSTVSATFARFFGADPATLGVVSMLAVLPSMWGRYHGWSRARVMKRGPSAADVVVMGAAPPLAVALVAAELGKACELAGATGVTVEAQSDGREHRFAVAWQPGAEAVV